MKHFYIIVLFIGICISATSQSYLTRYHQPFHTPTLNMLYHEKMKEAIGGGLRSEITKLFKDADRNNDRQIDLGELQSYQYMLKRRFKYKSNSTALHPNDFYAQGGGDCEDFAIMTTCLLNYYGIVAFVGSFGRVTTNKHSLCMVMVKLPVPPGYLYYTFNGYGVPKGTYIPVDYEKVGGLVAIDRRWKIARMTAPVDMYGKYW